MRQKPAHPCTGRTAIEGFDAFLRTELNDSRGNIKKLARDLRIITGEAHVTLVNSGSSANLTAAILVKQRCGVRRRVIMAGFSFPTTISSFTLLGFEVELVDTEADGFNLDPGALATAIGEDVAAVVVTHFLGFPAQLEAISALARQHGAMLVQDACETMDLGCGGQPIYDYGDVITHSFYHPHHLSAFGGGAVVTRSQELHDQLQSIMHWGRECRCHYDPATCAAPHGLNHNFWYVREGVNLELSELNACFARWQLKTWPQQEKLRGSTGAPGRSPSPVFPGSGRGKRTRTSPLLSSPWPSTPPASVASLTPSRRPASKFGASWGAPSTATRLIST
jgi:CDP-6-deoxy-D-xylo-4-hexulose-3-dehydrase